MALLQRFRDFVASFLDFFNARRSFGVIVGFFLASLFGLRSLDILFVPDRSTSNPLYRRMTNGRFVLVADIRFRLDRQSRQWRFWVVYRTDRVLRRMQVALLSDQTIPRKVYDDRFCFVHKERVVSRLAYVLYNL